MHMWLTVQMYCACTAPKKKDAQTLLLGSCRSGLAFSILVPTVLLQAPCLKMHACFHHHINKGKFEAHRPLISWRDEGHERACITGKNCTWNLERPVNRTSSTFKDMPIPGHMGLSSVNQPSLIPCVLYTDCKVFGTSSAVHPVPCLQGGAYVGRRARMEHTNEALRKSTRSWNFLTFTELASTEIAIGLLLGFLFQIGLLLNFFENFATQRCMQNELLTLKIIWKYESRSCPVSFLLLTNPSLEQLPCFEVWGRGFPVSSSNLRCMRTQMTHMHKCTHARKRRWWPRKEGQEHHEWRCHITQQRHPCSCRWALKVI